MSHYHFAELPSTNSWLMEKGQDEEHLTYVSCDFQSAGRGRFDRPWLACPGNLYFSVLLKYDIVCHQLFALNYLAPLILCQTLIKLGYQVGIKFPNDILLAQKKVAGILVESTIIGSSTGYAVAGFGVNLQGIPELLETRRFAPGCLAMDPRDLPSKPELMEETVQGFAKWNKCFSVEDVLSMYSNHLTHTINLRFRQADGKIVVGAPLKILSNGEIQLLLPTGNKYHLPSGSNYLDDGEEK